MKNEEKYLTNNSEISKEDFYQYNLFTATLSIKKPINLFLFGVITLVFMVFIVIFIKAGVEAIDARNSMEIMKNLGLAFTSTLVVIMNIYVYFKISNIILYMNRISMCITCATFPFVIEGFFVKENLSKNAGFIILFLVVSAFSILSLFTTRIFANKTYQRLGKLNYNFVFKPMQMEVSSITNDNKAKSNFNYEAILRIFEVGNFFYCYVTKFEALIINKNNFVNGSSEDFLRILFNNKKSAKLINW